MYPFNYVQQYMKPHFEMQKEFHTPAILLFESFNLDLKLKVLKMQPGYEGKWKRKRESRNQRRLTDCFK